MDGSHVFPVDLAERFDACDLAQFERERAELADCRSRGLRISAKGFQQSVVRYYLRLRRNRRIYA